MHDEDTTARLVRLAGPRERAPDPRAQRVRQAVHHQWRGAVRRRRTVRAVGMTVMAVTIVATWIVLVRQDDGIDRRAAAPPPAILAIVERADGPGTIEPGRDVRAGAWVDTSGGGRLALRLEDGTSLRVDAGSRLRLPGPGVVELAAGALYLDTGRHAARLEVRTRVGTLRDIGTQFEVRLDEAALRVRVRTGVVELHGSGDPIPARGGTELTLADGRATSRPFSPTGPAWDWAAALAPPYDIDGRALAGFLEHTAREQGLTLRYEDAGLARDASGIILHGSVDGLAAAEALAVALATSGLEHRVREGELMVSRQR